MDRKKLEIIITAVLIIVLVFAVSNAIKKASVRIPAPAMQPPADMPPEKQLEFLVKPQAAVSGLDEKAGKLDEEQSLGWGRDPFTLHELSQGRIENVQDLKLMGITIGEKMKPKAIINNELVTLGSKIGKFEVLRILSDKIVVNDGEKNFELKMNQ